MSNSHSIEAKAVMMTPTKAAGYIKRHMAVVEADDSKKNRKISDGGVNRYAADMKAGRWQLNGETIKIAPDGQILDGQHRLLACVQSNTSFQTLLVEEVASDSFQSIDIGISRTAGNLLYLAGCKNSTVLASALVLLWRWEQGGGKQFDRWAQTPSKPEQFDILSRHPKIQEYVGKIHVNAFKGLASMGLLATLWYLFAEKDETLADAFFDALSNGIGLQADDPVYVLRERLLKDRAMAAQRGGRQSMEVSADFFLRAWNATRKNEKIAKLQSPRLKGKSGKYRLQDMGKVERMRERAAGKDTMKMTAAMRRAKAAKAAETAGARA
jgi:hypothetical protein